MPECAGYTVAKAPAPLQRIIRIPKAGFGRLTWQLCGRDITFPLSPAPFRPDRIVPACLRSAVHASRLSELGMQARYEMGFQPARRFSSFNTGWLSGL